MTDREKACCTRENTEVGQSRGESPLIIIDASAITGEKTSFFFTSLLSPDSSLGPSVRTHTHARTHTHTLPSTGPLYSFFRTQLE